MARYKKMWSPNQWPLNPVVLLVIRKKGKHGYLQDMAMDESARGRVCREEREREVVVVSETFFFFFSPVSPSSLALENVL